MEQSTRRKFGTAVLCMLMVSFVVGAAFREAFISRKLEAAAKMSREELQRTVIAAALEARLVADDKGTIIWTSSSAARISGYVQAELMGMNADVLIPDRYKELHKQKSQQRISEGPTSKITRITCELKRKDGTERLVEISVAIMRDPTSPSSIIQVITILPVDRIEGSTAVSQMEDLR